jgi:hypothetical protein
VRARVVVGALSAAPGVADVCSVSFGAVADVLSVPLEVRAVVAPDVVDDVRRRGAGFVSCSWLLGVVFSFFERALLVLLLVRLACSVASVNSDVSFMKKTPSYPSDAPRWRWKSLFTAIEKACRPSTSGIGGQTLVGAVPGMFQSALSGVGYGFIES